MIALAFFDEPFKKLVNGTKVNCGAGSGSHLWATLLAKGHLSLTA
jgi:hypothetical protein